jgi:hypothetical protein
MTSTVSSVTLNIKSRDEGNTGGTTSTDVITAFERQERLENGFCFSNVSPLAKLCLPRQYDKINSL